MLLVGGGLHAHFAAWQMLATGTPFAWWANQHEPAEEGLPELALLPGPTLSLSHHGLKLWQQVAEQLPVLRTVPFADLATTPGRAVKLREEALLDALAGQAVVYEEHAPRGLHPRLVLGARHNAEAAQLVPDFAAQLKGALPRGPEPRRWQNADEFISQLPPDMPKVLVADDTLARDLGVPLQPRRRHTLVWALAQPLVQPVAPLLLLHRMPRGHTWLWLEAESLTLVYDGLADPRQAADATEPDGPTVEALATHAQQVLPYFKASAPQAPTVRVHTDMYLPDSLPYLGPWVPPQWQEVLHMRGINLFMAGGAGARSAIYAPALGEKLVELGVAQEYLQTPLAPSASRLTDDVPPSLRFTEPTAEAVPVAAAHTAEAPVEERLTPQIKEAPEVHRMEDVRMVSKHESGHMGTPQEKTHKPKIQTAAVKGN